MRRFAETFLVCALLAATVAAQPVVELTDPEGDDHGDGRFLYPSLGFEDGDLDVTGFEVENRGEHAVFTVRFARRIKQPGRAAADELGTRFDRIARHGFYQFNVDVYIDTDRRTGSGYTRLLPGRLAELAPDDAWDVAVVATPRPAVIKGVLHRILQAELAENDGDDARIAASLDRHVRFPTDFKVRGRELSFEVPHALLGGEARDTWAYTVVVTGADLAVSLEVMSGAGLREESSRSLGVLPVSPGEWTNRFGGGRSGEALQPPIIDLVVPAGVTQEMVLGDFSSALGRPAVLPGVVPAAGRAGAVATEVPAWTLQDWRGRIGYEIFVRSFKDSDGDGVGDFNGITAQLDYLNAGDPATDTDLGIDALWLMPVFASPSYHGYDCIDYDRLNPQYGTDEDFDRLLRECHRRGIAVVLDLMLNHSSDRHPWFVDSARGPDSPKRDWYVWRADDPGWVQPWGGSNRVWHERGGAYYYGIFWSGMPDLNFRNPAVMAEAQGIAARWLDRGVDGFRLDAARHLVAAGPGRQQNDTPETHAAWRVFSAFMRTHYPDRLMLGEIWSGPDDIAPYFGDADVVPGGDEFAMCFDFELSGGIIQTVNLGDAGPVSAALARIAALYPDGVLDGTFLANHDMTRLATQLGGDRVKQGQAAALLLTLPGTPWLYYGEEVGLRNGPAGSDEEKRTPMPWTDTDAGFTAGAPWYRFSSGRDIANVAAQTHDPASLLSRYRRLIRARRGSAALREGDVASVPLDGAPRDGVAYLRTAADERVLVVHTLANAPRTFSWSAFAGGYELLFGDRGVGLPVEGAITLPARATGVWLVVP